MAQDVRDENLRRSCLPQGVVSLDRPPAPVFCFSSVYWDRRTQVFTDNFRVFYVFCVFAHLDAVRYNVSVLGKSLVDFLLNPGNIFVL